MEKEGAEKATTEFDNSVTGKEDNSLAEKNENNNGVKAEITDNSANAEVPSATIEDKIEGLPPEAESEDKGVDSPEESVESKPESAADVGNNDIPEDSKVEEKTLAIEENPEIGDETPLIENKPKAEEAPSEDSGADVNARAAQAESKVDSAIEEDSSVEIDSKVEDLPKEEESEDELKNSTVEPIKDESESESAAKEGKNADSEESQTEEEAPVPEKKPEKEPIKLETAVDNVADAIEETAKPEIKDASEEKKKTSGKKESASADKVIEEHHEADEHHEEYQNADFTTYSKEELVEVIKNLGKDENPFLADRILKQIAPLFNQIRGQEREATLKQFIKEGGAEDDFQYKPDELSLRFDANYKLIKDKKTKRFKEQDKQRGKNLIIAEEVLGELRDFVDSEESSNSFNAFKAIQQKWKDIGDVPSQNSRTLWANYNALVHRFYDQRSIYFELKELDRRKNYESKLVLCDKAETLVNIENLREAIKGLNDLHHEFKHMGPVPQELQEDLWQRFKAASDKVYERRKAFVHELKAELHENLVKKQDLIEKIKLFIDFQSDRIKEWNEKTKELIALQKSWETIGGLPKDKAKQINKDFWSSFKKFFSNKHQFFKKLDADRDEHLTKKQALLEQATALKDSEEWEKTANELKKLQGQWREIGPVPEKMRKKLYEEFKACCDHFFEQRRVGLKNSQDNYKLNLQNKKKVIEEIIKLQKDADKNLDKFNELRNEFLDMGYVPKKNIDSIKEEYQKAIEDYLNTLTVLNVKQKTEISLEAEFASLAGSEHSETELYHKEQSVRRQINKLEDDIALWQNNLEFFAHSKSTDKLREEVNKKIDDANVHVDSLKRQLKMLRTL